MHCSNIKLGRRGNKDFSKFISTFARLCNGNSFKDEEIRIQNFSCLYLAK